MTQERERYGLWLEAVKDIPDYDRELRDIEADEEEILDRFYRDLSFGTAGLRGVLGLGSNRMNVYTVRRATQAFAMQLLEASAHPSVAIAYDSRINSELFAREAACVFAANGIRVHLYAELMPTPALSYAVRELGCDAGVNITASHNPAKYNGYKAYGSDGCQIGPAEADRILALMEAIDMFHGAKSVPFEEALRDGGIQMIPDDFVGQYIDRVFREAIAPEVCAKSGLRLVYTPLNGAGRRCVTEVLQKAGMRDIALVKEQEMPDGNFPTCPYPNPELREALELGLRLCRDTQADLLLATDPDCDRVAVAVKAGEDYRILTGNEVGVLLLDYIAKARKQAKTMPERPVAVKSLVSTKLADMVAAGHGVEMKTVLTGFKYIGETILELEKKGEEDRFIFGFEESCGYLSGPFVRDKDAVNASLLLVEMACAYKLAGKTLADALDDIYGQYGIFLNVVASYAYEGARGMAQMAEIMQSLRENPPTEIAGCAVRAYTDYLSSRRIENGAASAVTLPPSDVLEYGLDDGCTIIIRPSGTEPKIKIYYMITGRTDRETEDKHRLLSAACEKMMHIG